MTISTGRRVAFSILAGVGGLIWLLEVTLHVTGYFTGRPYEINHTVILIGTLFGFVGFFGLDPRQAKEGAGFAVEQSVKLARAFPRFGRRASDAIAVPRTETTITAVPAPVSDTDEEKEESAERPRFARTGGVD